MIPKILVVEDERDIRELIALHLSRDGYSVDQAVDGEDALQKIQSNTYQLFLFDWMLPGISGLELTRTAREKGAPILMVTARVEPADVVVGLEAGADDYVTKPFEIPVLLARVRALLRRSASARAAATKKPASKLELGEIAIDLDAHEVACAGQALQLTVSEFKLLVGLAQNQGKVLTRTKLMEMVQGTGVSVVDRTIDTHVFGLRKKLGECGDLIETIRGIGYRIRG